MAKQEVISKQPEINISVSASKQLKPKLVEQRTKKVEKFKTKKELPIIMTEEENNSEAIESVDKKSSEVEEPVTQETKIEIKSETKPENIEVDVSNDTKAIELSELSSKYNITRYTDDEEAMEDIDITDKSLIKSLPFYSLCNRIKRFAFKDGYYSGYTRRMADESVEEIDKLKSKLAKAEKKIRVLKTLSKVLSRVLYSCTTHNIFDMKEDIENEVKNKQELDSITLKSIYSTKDLRDYNAISRVTTLLELTKNK